MMSERASRILRIALLATTIAVLISVPFWAGRGTQRLLVEMFCYLALAQLWNLLAGYTGLISVGQQAWVGLGGYVMFALVMLGGLPVLAAIPLAALIAGVFAIPTAALAFRMKGAYFAIGTWVIAEVYRLSAAQVGILGGGSGISLPADYVRAIAATRGGREQIVYYLALAIVLVVVLGLWALLRSGRGLALAAIRDDEEAARASGVPQARIKFAIYVGVAALTALIGALIFLEKLRISPEAAFSVNDWTVAVIFIVVIGGIASIEGPILGCILFFALREHLSHLGNWYMVILGSIAIAVMLVEPKGLWGLFRRFATWQVFPTSRVSGRVDR